MHEPPAGWCWFDLMLSASWFFSATRGWPTIRATSGAIRSSTILGIYLCLCWCASRVHCATARRSGDQYAPPALAQVRAKLKQHADGDQQFVKVLGAVLAHGLSAVEAACAEALAAGIASGDVIRTVLARRHQPPTPASITTPDGLRLKVEPVADCGQAMTAYERSPDGTPRDPGRHDRIEALRHAREFRREIAGKGLARRDEIYPLIASLDQGRTHASAGSLNQLSHQWRCKFPVLIKDLDKFVFGDTMIDEGQVRELATGAFLDAKRNAIFIGGTGTGKTHLCIGVASAIIRSRARGRFFNLVDLVNQLEQDKAAGRSGRLAETLLLRYDVIVIDELGYLPFSQSGGQLLSSI